MSIKFNPCIINLYQSKLQCDCWILSMKQGIDRETKIARELCFDGSLIMFSLKWHCSVKVMVCISSTPITKISLKSNITYSYLSLATLEPWIPITQYLMVLGKAHNWNDLWIWLFLLQACTHHSLLYNVGSCHHKNINIFHLLFRLTILNITMSTSALPTKSLFGLRFKTLH